MVIQLFVGKGSLIAYVVQAVMNGRVWWKRCGKIVCVSILAVICIRFTIQPPCILGIVPIRYYKKLDTSVPLPPDITVVTAYFNIGQFYKGDFGTVFGPTVYLEWASVYKHLRNPLVVYTDSDQFLQLFTVIRHHVRHITKIIKVEKKDLWAFDYLDKIGVIYSNPTYPKHHPNTVVPEYSCVQHAKYSCMEDAIENNYMKTGHFMWLDIGYFRYLTSRDKDFALVLPPRFDSMRISVNQVNLGYSMDETPELIFKTNAVWVGGGLSLGTKEVYQMFIKDYRRALERYLSMNLSNTDQQVMFAMSTKSEREILKPSVLLQPYVWDTWGSCWYFLGYQCYREIEDSGSTSSTAAVI